MLASLVVMPASAQSSPATEEESRQDTVLVQAVRRELPAEALPNTVRIIDRDALAQQMLISTNLADIVGAKVPSFSPSRQKLSGAGESFRGREPLYLIDGIPQSNPLRNGSRDGFTIDPAVVETVEIIYGANAIQGVGATGGVINYVTLRPAATDRWQARVEAATTAPGGLSGDGFGYRGAATVLRDFGAFDLVASVAAETRGAFYDAEDRRIGIDGAQGDIQDSRSVNLFAKLGWQLGSDTRIQFTANLFELEGEGDYIAVSGNRATGLPTGAVRGMIEGVPPTNSVNTFSLDYVRDDLFGGKLSAQAFYREFESIFGGGTFDGFFNTGTEAPGQETFDQSANTSNKTGIKLTYSNSDLPVDGLTLTLGADYLVDETFQALIQTGRLWVPNVEFQSLAPFVQVDKFLFSERLLISVGVRQENATLKVDDFTTIFSSGSTFVAGGKPNFSQTLWNFGTSFEVIEGLQVYAAYSEGFTMPDVGRVLRAINVPGQDVDDLLSIDPIVADNAEIGANFTYGGLSANVSYFWSESEFGQRLFSNSAGIFEVRREPTEIKGFEISAEFAPRTDLVFGGSYAALEGRSDQNRDGRIAEDLSGENISPDRANIYVEGSPLAPLALRAQASVFLDRTFNDTATNTDFDGYVLVDLSAGYVTDRFGRFDLGVQNAFDTDYVTYFSQTAPSAVNSSVRFFTGRGRTLTLRWSATY
jgi:iron complex outermembrane receptor protein